MADESEAPAAAESKAARAAAPVSVDAVLLVIEELRREFRIGVDQVLAIQRLLATLAAHGATLEDPEELGRYIGPIVCKSRDEQRLFRERFGTWLRVALRAGPTIRDDSGFEGRISRDVRGVRRRRRLWAWASGVLLVAIGFALIWQALKPPEVHSSPAPVASPEPVRIERGTRIAPVPQPLELRNEVVHRQPIPLTNEVFGGAVPTLFGVIIGLLVLKQLLRRWGAWAEARRFLARDVEVEPKTLEEMHQAISVEALRDPSIKAVANVLREREITARSDLDVTASAVATARAGGLFVPVEKPLRRLPDYLALIERESRHDMQAAFFDRWLDQVKDEDVPVSRYYFQRDPRLLAASDGQRAPRTLAQVQAVTAEHRVMVFSDAERFLDPFSGRPRPWVRNLTAWPERALLTPEPASYWADRESALADAGLRVVPATNNGLARIRHGEAARSVAGDFDEDEGPPIPAFILERVRAWVHDDAPPVRDVALLLGHVRAYLGADGYFWLAACALYPQVRWPLAVGLGSWLEATDGGRILERTRLLRLARLPWMRASYMPDWFRTALLRSLDTHQLESARRALYIVLTSTLSPGNERLVLELSRAKAGPLREVWRKILRRVRQHAAQNDPSNDRVFLRWIDDGVGLRIPLSWARHLRDAVQRTAGAPIEPPHVVASAISAALGIGYFSALGMAGIVEMLHAFLPKLDDAGVAVKVFALGPLFLVPRGFSTWVGTLRWRAPTYAGAPWLERRIVIDGLAASIPLLALAVLFVAHGKTPSSEDVASAIVIVALEALRGALGWRRLVAWSRSKAGEQTGRPGRLARLVDRFTPVRLAILADRLALDRWFVPRRKWPANLPEPSRIVTALFALLAGPCTFGLGALAYAALLPLRYLGDPRRRQLGRALFENSLTWLPMLAGVTVIPGSDDVAWLGLLGRWPTGRVLLLWAGSSLVCIVAYLVSRAGDRSRRWNEVDSGQPSLEPTSLERASRVADRWFPDRWPSIRPVGWPILAFSACLWGATTWSPTLTTLRTVQLAAPAFVWFGWPTENTVSDVWVAEQVSSAALSPDGMRLVTGSSLGNVRIWPFARKVASTELSNHKKEVRCIAFSRDGLRFATGSSDNTARIWALDGSYIELTGHSAPVTSVAFSPDGSRVATVASQDGTVRIRIWRTSAPGSGVRMIETSGSLRQIAFSSTGSHLLTDTGYVEVWSVDASPPAVILRLSDRGSDHLVFNSDATKVAAATRTLSISDTDGSGPTISLEGGDQDFQRITSMAFSPDGTRLVTASSDHTMKVWNLNGSGSSVEFQGPIGSVGSVAFSPDSTRIVTGSDDGTARVWDADGTGEPLVLRADKTAIVSVEWSADGTKVFARSETSAYVWTLYRQSWRRDPQSGGTNVPPSPTEAPPAEKEPMRGKGESAAAPQPSPLPAGASKARQAEPAGGPSPSSGAKSSGVQAPSDHLEHVSAVTGCMQAVISDNYRGEQMRTNHCLDEPPASALVQDGWLVWTMTDPGTEWTIECRCPVSTRGPSAK